MGVKLLAFKFFLILGLGCVNWQILTWGHEGQGKGGVACFLGMTVWMLIKVGGCDKSFQTTKLGGKSHVHTLFPSRLVVMKTPGIVKTTP